MVDIINSNSFVTSNENNSCWSYRRCEGFLEISWDRTTGRGSFGTIRDVPSIRDDLGGLNSTSVGSLKATQISMCIPSEDTIPKIGFEYYVPLSYKGSSLVREKFKLGSATQDQRDKYPFLGTLLIAGSVENINGREIVRQIYRIGTSSARYMGPCSTKGASDPVEKTISFANIVTSTGEIGVFSKVNDLITSQLPPHNGCSN